MFVLSRSNPCPKIKDIRSILIPTQDLKNVEINP